jgi:hypothetical protein
VTFENEEVDADCAILVYFLCKNQLFQAIWDLAVKRILMNFCDIWCRRLKSHVWQVLGKWKWRREGVTLHACCANIAFSASENSRIMSKRPQQCIKSLVVTSDRKFAAWNAKPSQIHMILVST